MCRETHCDLQQLGKVFFFPSYHNVLSKPLALFILLGRPSLLLALQQPPQGPATGKARRFFSTLSTLSGGVHATVPVSIVHVLTGVAGAGAVKSLCGRRVWAFRFASVSVVYVRRGSYLNMCWQDPTLRKLHVSLLVCVSVFCVKIALPLAFLRVTPPPSSM